MHIEHPEHDPAIRGWFDGRGWPVTATQEDDDREVFAWRHDSGQQRYTLRVTRNVLDDTKPGKLTPLFDRLRVADALRQNPDAYTVIFENKEGEPAIAQLAAPPSGPIE